MRGFASLISIVIVLLIGFLIMRTYLQTSLKAGTQGSQRTAIDAARDRAAQVEDVQRKQLEQADQLAE